MPFLVKFRDTFLVAVCIQYMPFSLAYFSFIFNFQFLSGTFLMFLNFSVIKTEVKEDDVCRTFDDTFFSACYLHFT